jgi:hypothetical protein
MTTLQDNSDAEENLVLTDIQIKSIESFNIEALKEAGRQAELRVSDENIRKDRMDLRASILLTMFVGITGLTFNTLTMPGNSIQKSVLLASVILPSIISIFYLLKNLSPRPYGEDGLPTNFISNKYFIEDFQEDNQKRLGYMMASSLRYAHENLSLKKSANCERLKLYNKALIIGIGSLVPITLFVFYTIFSFFIG